MILFRWCAFLANRHILSVIGDLRGIRIQRRKGRFLAPNWSFARGSKRLLFGEGTSLVDNLSKFLYIKRLIQVLTFRKKQ